MISIKEVDHLAGRPLLGETGEAAHVRIEQRDLDCLRLSVLGFAGAHGHRGAVRNQPLETLAERDDQAGVSINVGLGARHQPSQRGEHDREQAQWDDQHRPNHLPHQRIEPGDRLIQFEYGGDAPTIGAIWDIELIGGVSLVVGFDGHRAHAALQRLAQGRLVLDVADLSGFHREPRRRSGP